MKNYGSYELMDFLQDDDFCCWVRGQETLSKDFWESFTEQFPEKSAEFNRARVMVIAIGRSKQVIDPWEIRTESEALLEKISMEEEIKEPDVEDGKSGVFWSSKRSILVILSVISFLAAGTFFYKSNDVQTGEHETESLVKTDLVKTHNQSIEPLKILLGDNSEVILSPKSVLKYPPVFSGSTREVFLEGEAEFSVHRGENPFYVYAGGTITKVLGTQFTVSAFETDRKTTIRVRTGTVSVFEKPSANTRAASYESAGLIIKANQEAVFEKKERQFKKTLVSDPIKIEKVPNFETKRYDEVPLTKIISDIEKVYGISIVVPRETFSKCRITATLSDENMYQKLNILCKSIDARYEIVDGQIVIIGKGC